MSVCVLCIIYVCFCVHEDFIYKFLRRRHRTDNKLNVMVKEKKEKKKIKNVKMSKKATKISKQLKLRIKSYNLNFKKLKARVKNYATTFCT